MCVGVVRGLDSVHTHVTDAHTVHIVREYGHKNLLVLVAKRFLGKFLCDLRFTVCSKSRRSHLVLDSGRNVHLCAVSR